MPLDYKGHTSNGPGDVIVYDVGFTHDDTGSVPYIVNRSVGSPGLRANRYYLYDGTGPEDDTVHKRLSPTSRHPCIKKNKILVYK